MFFSDKNKSLTTGASLHGRGKCGHKIKTVSQENPDAAEKAKIFSKMSSCFFCFFFCFFFFFNLQKNKVKISATVIDPHLIWFSHFHSNYNVTHAS